MSNWDRMPVPPAAPGLSPVNGGAQAPRSSRPGASPMYLRHIRNLLIAGVVALVVGAGALVVIAVCACRVAGVLP